MDALTVTHAKCAYVLQLQATKLLQASILKVDMSDLELDPMEAAEVPGADADLQDAVAGYNLPQHAPAADGGGDVDMDEGPDANAENDAAAANRTPGVQQQQQQGEKAAAAAAEKQVPAVAAAAQPEPPKPARINAKKFEFIKVCFTAGVSAALIFTASSLCMYIEDMGWVGATYRLGQGI